MYGLINRGFCEMISTQFGKETWEQVAAKAGQAGACYEKMHAYPDEVTYSLVGAACSVLNQPAEQVLEAYGEYWVEYAARTAYSSLMNTSGSDLRTFLSRLDDMHLKISFTMPHLQPPSFVCEDIDICTLKLHYYSQRAGLSPMVKGLLYGLARRFQQNVEVEQICSAESCGHDVFIITFLDQTSAHWNAQKVME